MPYSNEDLIEDIRAVAATVGETPTLSDYRENGTASATTLYNRFGSWQGALEAAGFEAREPDVKVSEDELLAELERLASEQGEPPTVAMMNTDGKYWASTYRRTFGSWNKAREAADIDLAAADDRQSVSKEALLDELRRVADARGAPPTTRAMEQVGEYGASTYFRRFGSWSDAVAAAGFEPNDQVGTESVSTTDLKAELRRLAELTGDPPTVSDLREHGHHALRTYQQRFGSWSAALAATFEDVNPNDQPDDPDSSHS